jgi:hypothetical protein
MERSGLSLWSLDKSLKSGELGRVGIIAVLEHGSEGEPRDGDIDSM